MSTSLVSTGVTFPDSSTQKTAATGFGFKNRIINGGFNIFQRASTATTVTLNGPGYTTADRFFSYQNGTAGVQTSQVAASLSGFPYAIKWGRPSGNTTTGITVLGQALETQNSFDLQGQSVTLSFYAKSGANFSAASSQIGVLMFSGTGTDQSATSMVTGAWTGSSNPISNSATLTTSWQRFTYTATLGSSVSQVGIYFSWSPVGTAGSDDNVYITGIQIEKSPTATAFDVRSIGTELLLCQRYYEIGSTWLQAGGTPTSAGYGVQFSVPKRTASTNSFSNITYNLGSLLTDYTSNLPSPTGINSLAFYFVPSGNSAYVKFSYSASAEL